MTPPEVMKEGMSVSTSHVIDQVAVAAAITQGSCCGGGVLLYEEAGCQGNGAGTVSW